VIADKAQELGRLIGQSDEYRALKRAQERLREAPELAERLRKLESLARNFEGAAARGEEPSEAEVQTYDELLATIQADPVYQGVVAAQVNFDKLMLRVNEHIMAGIKKGAASPIITLS
jgi:cell fate (sporulation/competence/biofilm development) regulator YlbF (YheA/YmcA/DUF963 family)